MPYVDVLRGLKALFLERPESPDRRALLARRAPGLAPDERRTLEALEDDRVDIYVGMLRGNQTTMLDFVAPSTFEVAAELGGVSRAEFARATLVETPRATSRLRELAQRVIDHLEGAGRACVERCPAILDLARLERAQTEAFYAPDVDGALAPRDFAERVAGATVDEVLAFTWRVAPSVRIVALGHDVLAWRERRHADGAWKSSPERLDVPLEALVVRDPESLQPMTHRIAPTLLDLVRPRDAELRTLERLAEAWLVASGASSEDSEAPARFFEQAAEWVRIGVIAVIPTSDAAPSTSVDSEVVA